MWYRECVCRKMLPPITSWFIAHKLKSANRSPFSFIFPGPFVSMMSLKSVLSVQSWRWNRPSVLSLPLVLSYLSLSGAAGRSYPFFPLPHHWVSVVLDGVLFDVFLLGGKRGCDDAGVDRFPGNECFLCLIRATPWVWWAPSPVCPEYNSCSPGDNLSCPFCSHLVSLGPSTSIF